MENKRRQPPRKKGFNYMKKKNVQYGFSVISLMIMIPVFFLTALFLIFIPRSEKSNIEKRNLAKFPAFTFQDYFSGKFTSQITEFYDDTVPDRDNFKNMGYSFKALFGFHTDDGVKIVGKPVSVVNDTSEKTENSGAADNNKPDAKTSDKKDNKTDTSKTEKQESKAEAGNKVNTEKDEYKEASNGLIVVKHDGHYRGLELFGGGSGNEYVDALNNFHNDLGSGVQIYSMVPSTASEYYLPDDYKQYNVSQKDTVDSFSANLDPSIKYVDAITALGNHSNEEIYLRTDHHWTPLGAYYAAQTFAQAAGVDFKDISTYKKVDIEGFSGTLAAWAQDADLTADTETFSYYVPSNYDKCTTYYYTTSLEEQDPLTGNFFCGVGSPEYNAYLTFMGGDEQVVHVNTNVKNGRKLMIVKDSYGNAIPGYLFGSFEDIYVVDMRYFDSNLVNYIKSEGVTDLLFAMVSFSAVGGNADNLNVIRTQ